MQSDELQDHIRKSYYSLRIGLAGLAALLPVLLVVLGYIAYGISLQPSLSDYYFALPDIQPPLRNFPMRGCFVGVLCSIGSFLILYRGFSNTENWLLNIAGASAIGVALVHMTVPQSCLDCGGPVFPWWPWAHFFFAVILFVCLAWVSWACSEETLGELPQNKQKTYRVVYDLFAYAMLLFPFFALVLTQMFGMADYRVIAIETIGVWIFALYWYVKSLEMKSSDADVKVASRKKAKSLGAKPLAEDDIRVAPAGPRRPRGRFDGLRMRAARAFNSEPMQELPRTA